MDGVLADTARFHFQAFTEIFRTRGVPFDWEAFRSMLGMSNQAFFQKFLGPGLDERRLEELLEEKEALFLAATRGQVQPTPGVDMWLSWFKRQGMRQAVASSSPPATVAELVRALGFERFFSAQVTAGALPGKPDPSLFLQAARELDRPPRRCLVIEDGLAGVEAARRAGMPCVAITTTNPVGALQAADLVVEQFDEHNLETVAARFFK